MDDRDKRVRQAWRRYLRATKDLSGPTYEAAEPEEWAILRADLQQIGVEVPGRRKVAVA